MLRGTLVVNDEVESGSRVARLLQDVGHEVRVVRSWPEALATVSRAGIGVVVLDVSFFERLGPEVVPALLAADPDLAVVVSSGDPSRGSAPTDLALACIQAGATDFVDHRDLVERLAVLGAEAPDAASVFRDIVSRSSVMRNVFHLLEPAVRSRVPVLVRGESGTGKELVARALHDGGARRDGPFVAVNCAGIPEHLLEAEIFGFERGAFTGALGRKPGRFDLAQGGTLLLDEVGELHPALQAKLLRVLQEGEYQRLGGVETLRADVRVIAATHRDLEREVERGRFRQDLYYRLAVFTVDLPPLRDRIGDVPLLVEHFVAAVAEREGRRITGVEPMVRDLLAEYSFPGNVRELQNVVTHAVVSCRGTVVRVADLPAAFRRAVAMERGAPGATPDIASRTETPTHAFPTLRAIERQHVMAALERADGNKARAARLLGVSRMTLYRKLQELEVGDLSLSERSEPRD